MMGSPFGDPILSFLGVNQMIRHLNDFSFTGYGTRSRLPDVQTIRSETTLDLHLELEGEKQPVYKTVADIWLWPEEGMTVVSVSNDGVEFESYYLDQPVCLCLNKYFYLSPMRQEKTMVELCSNEPPQIVDAEADHGRSFIQSNMHVTGIYTIFYHEKERGFCFSGESHSVLELTYVDQGTVHSVADGQELVLAQGDMVLYGANQWHMQYADIDVAPRYVTISFEVQDGNLDALLNRKLRPSQAGVTLIQQILREKEKKDPWSMDMIAAQLTQLLLSLLRQQESTSKLMASNSLNAENEIIRRAQQYISAHIRDKLSVPHVARMVDVSPSYMTALFHKNLQISPGEYIRRIKIQESKQLIREGNMNFTEIAEALHYSTVHHFSRQFKDKFGITPTEYAKSVR
jgi:AraC-like DNA-binding protein